MHDMVYRQKLPRTKSPPDKSSSDISSLSKPQLNTLRITWYVHQHPYVYKYKYTA